jgi:glycosyltransferase involved in cell wall biosynthesis
MRKKLYLVTTDFPYGRGENSFIMPELPYLKEKFDITIISNSLEHEQTVILDDDIRIIHYERKASFLCKLWDSICYFGCKDAYLELWDIIRSERKKLRCFMESVLFFEEARRFERFLKKNQIIDSEEPAIIYNYWFTYYCLAVVRMFGKNSNIKIVTRAHRYDLYDEGYQGGRQPFKRQMDKNLDNIIFIAEHGRQYYLNKYNKNCSEKYQLFRLGVTPTGRTNIGITNKYNQFMLVSCSLVIPRKRVELIVDALTEIDDIDIKWIHFGDGPDLDNMVDYAKGKLDCKNNISYEFKGFVESEQIMEFYEGNFVDAFITTTESEGCPVSVQEAMAYGIPIIGTDIAEIPYMIHGNGILLGANPKNGEVSRAIKAIHGLSEQDVALMREKSYQLWKENFDGAVNAKKFVAFLEN